MIKLTSLTKKSLGTAAVLVSAAALLALGFAVSATVTQSRATPVQEVNTAGGSIELTGGTLNDSVTSEVDNMLPGQSASRTLVVENNATFNFSSIALNITDSQNSIFTTDTTHGLQVTVDRCNAAFASCSTVISQRPILSKEVSGQTFDNIAGPALTSEGTDYLRVTLHFPSTADATFLDKTALLTYTFTAQQ